MCLVHASSDATINIPAPSQIPEQVDTGLVKERVVAMGGVVTMNNNILVKIEE